MAQVTAIIDYGSGNLRSVEKAFERSAREAGFAVRIIVTDDAEVIAGADRIVLPGVGAFEACMNGLAARTGVIEALEHAVLVRAQPFLGICVGMQLLATRGLEFGEHSGLGWIDGQVEAIDGASLGVTSPHMGWNEVKVKSPRPAAMINDGAAYYFLHGFHFVPENDVHALAFTHHGQDLVAAIGRDNILGVQFHPEKSQAAGLGLIAKFLAWQP